VEAENHQAATEEEEQASAREAAAEELGEEVAKQQEEKLEAAPDCIDKSFLFVGRWCRLLVGRHNCSADQEDQSFSKSAKPLAVFSARGSVIKMKYSVLV
jgi:hypothetical protein